MDNFLNKKTVLGLFILSLLAANTSIQPMNAKDNNKNNNNKDRASAKEIEKVELSKPVIELIKQMGEDYQYIANNSYITGEDILTLEKNKTLPKFIDDLVDYYRSLTDPQIKENIQDIGSLLDKYQDEFNVTLTLRFGGFEPYTQGTRYAVFSLQEILNTYN